MAVSQLFGIGSVVVVVVVVVVVAVVVVVVGLPVWTISVQ